MAVRKSMLAITLAAPLGLTTTERCQRSKISSSEGRPLLRVTSAPGTCLSTPSTQRHLSLPSPANLQPARGKQSGGVCGRVGFGSQRGNLCDGTRRNRAQPCTTAWGERWGRPTGATTWGTRTSVRKDLVSRSALHSNAQWAACALPPKLRQPSGQVDSNACESRRSLGRLLP
jgi:hypothetical protein